MAAIYYAWHGTVFKVAAGSLATSVALFLLGSVVCISIMQIRRFSPKIGAELGGPTSLKWISGGAFFVTWVFYVAYCSLDAYCLLPS
ncbi:CBN-NCX-1 protein [Aphelenchoides avenae]|nr:CBN-NCX-1 protein [Aphelenchus avenae]